MDGYTAQGIRQDQLSITCQMSNRSRRTQYSAIGGHQLNLGCVPMGAHLRHSANMLHGLNLGPYLRAIHSVSPVVVAEEGSGFLSVVCNLSENRVKEWALTKVAAENGKFVHESVGTYFSLQGALKAHCSLLGVLFEEESIDEYA